jgi:predicted ArsR family transcriptional regulator
MLQRLLAILREGRSHTIGDLAEELGTSPSLVEAMMENLSLLGYLRQVEAASGCSQECSCCPVNQGCTVGGSTKIWNLTDKGKKTARGIDPLTEEGRRF